jgi:hypothetical protein
LAGIGDFAGENRTFCACCGNGAADGMDSAVLLIAVIDLRFG